jgi:FlgD Ig-like domain
MRSLVLVAAFLCLSTAPVARAQTALQPPLPESSIPSVAMPAAALALTPEQTIWLNRALAGMAASNVLIEDIMNGGDAYAIGRDGGNYTEALIMAYRASGDRRFLDRVLQVTQLARAKLRDAWLDGTTDGYTGWLWLVDPTNTTYYGKDTNWLDESISSGNAALWMYTFNQNRQLDPAYAEAADFWRNWLETQFLAKSYARAGSALAAWNTPRSANWRLAYYLWKVTGNTFYRDREQEIRTQLVNAFQVNPTNGLAYRWARQLDPTTQEWMTINYANYVTRVVSEMNLEGVPFFSSPVPMKRFASTFRDMVYGKLLVITTMKNDVNGGGSTTFALYAMNAFSPWDSTGFLMSLADLGITGAGHYAGGGTSKAARNDVFIASYALMALAPRGSVGVEPGVPSTAGLSLASEPNPFTSSATIRLTVPAASHVRLSIIDPAGRRVRTLRDADLPAGRYAVTWDGRDDAGAPVPSGIYFQVADAGGRSVVRRTVRVR